MGNWLDKERGILQGRIEPDGITPPDQAHVFVLGADSQTELATIGGGDFSELSQVVDLTDFDLVAATMDTIGVAMGQHQPMAGWKYNPNTLFLFNLDYGADPVPNLREGWFDLTSQGDMKPAKETYSPDSTYCREIPKGSLTGKLTGVNAPQALPPFLTQYTFQWWMNFSSDDHDGSTGINPLIWSMLSPGVGGIEVSLSGVAGPGAHEWYVSMRHVNWAADMTNLFNVGPGGVGPGLVIDGSPGWHLYSIRFDLGLGWPNQCELFQDDILVAAAAALFPSAPAQPAILQPLQYGDVDMWGQIDAVRLLDKHLLVHEIGWSHDDCVLQPAPVDFEWKMELRVDGETYMSRIIQPGEQRRWRDIKAPVRRLVGEHEVGFRLTLVEKP